MEFDYFAEESLSADRGKRMVHYLFKAADGMIIQTSDQGCCRRDDPLLATYLTTVLAGRPLPGFAYLGKIEISDDQARPMIDVLSYKAYVEEKLHRVNRALSIHAHHLREQLHIQTPVSLVA